LRKKHPLLRDPLRRPVLFVIMPSPGGGPAAAGESGRKKVPKKVPSRKDHYKTL
jgi:hypothetical protein